MAAITAALVKELRDKTGVGMMDCKKALAETSGNIEKAIDWLRKQGLAAAAKKAGRTASEGLIGVATKGNSATLIEINSETDFVSRNVAFQSVVNEVASLALESSGEIENLKRSPFPGTNRNVEEEIKQLVVTIGENINLRRISLLTINSGVIGSYVHAATAPGLGRIGAIVAIESEHAGAELKTLAHQLAMHIAAARPQSVSVDDLKEEDVNRERNILREQAAVSGKSPDIINKMVEGRLKKFYEEVVLLEQRFVIDGETKVANVISEISKNIGTSIKVTGFRCFELGEGIEKEEVNFADEVAAQLK